ncbi:GGDEF domain-containing protein [Bacillus infantis]|uniref:GGDEF domain-containing protein n=1 Tax=Bacillus infantis TaxID=324767 RepID=UPI00101C8F60|nr:GGDEF domain-containing protein [Bacillus infantis]RYI27565.1 GGDEF domain-containing protein [Bacillus infantis]
MRKYNSYMDFKRVIYLYMIPLILLAMVSYNLMENDSEDNLETYLTRILIAWNIISWAAVYKRKFLRAFELATLAIISAAHIAIIYDGVFNYIGKGKEGAFGVSVIWVPAVILIFFLILRAKWGAVYSLFIFVIIFAFGLMNLPNASGDSLESLAQFYVAYLFYILVFYMALHLFKLFSELESMKRVAYTDSLTGIANRLRIDGWLEEWIKKSEGFSVIFFDIDHFKCVNDTYGHDAGDLVLKQLASLVRQPLTGAELFGRWGGEEFIILTPKTGESAVNLAEKLRKVIMESSFPPAGNQTASFGVAQYKKGDTVDSLLSRADQGLYQSKHEGRNRVTFGDEGQI